MVRTPGLECLILVLALLVTPLLQQPVEGQEEVWDARLVPPLRCRQHRNLQRNLERWLRRRVRRERQRPRPKRLRRRRATREAPPSTPVRTPSAPPAPLYPARRKAKEQGRTVASPPSPQPPDPLDDLRARRGWVDRIPRPELWRVLVRIRWPNGPRCPHCGEEDLQYLELIEPTYRDGWAVGAVESAPRPETLGKGGPLPL